MLMRKSFPSGQSSFELTRTYIGQRIYIDIVDIGNNSIGNLLALNEYLYHEETFIDDPPFGKFIVRIDLLCNRPLVPLYWSFLMCANDSLGWLSWDKLDWVLDSLLFQGRSKHGIEFTFKWLRPDASIQLRGIRKFQEKKSVIKSNWRTYHND